MIRSNSVRIAENKERIRNITMPRDPDVGAIQERQKNVFLGVDKVPSTHNGIRLTTGDMVRGNIVKPDSVRSIAEPKQIKKVIPIEKSPVEKSTGKRGGHRAGAGRPKGK